MNIEYMNRNDEDGIILINIVEELVTDRIKELSDKFQMCQCEQCMLNACAIALNALPPKYVSSTMGALLSQLEASKVENQTSIDVAIIKSLQKVKKNPMHKIFR